MQATKLRGRAELVAALNRAAREASGLGVLFGEAVAERLGISASDAECLGIVMLGEGATAGDLARATGLTTGAVTGVIDRLERAGLARRERDPADRRKVHVRPTEKAHRRGEALYGSFGAAIDRLAESYSEPQLRLLIDYFERAATAIRSEIDVLKAARSPRR